MRSDEIDPASLKILGLGDSVLNGGVQTDQDSLSTSILSRILSEEFSKKVQILNISAGSWGPDNCGAYLQERGLFDAQIMLLIVSSHDAHDNMDFLPVVGTNPSYPDNQYFSAIYEAWDRYIWPQYIKPKLFKDSLPRSQAELEIRKSGKTFNPGFNKLNQLATQHHIPILIYLHPEQSEVKQGAYNDQGKEIIEYARIHDIPLIQELHCGIDSSWYRDNIHLNNKGQRKMSEILHSILTNYISD
ncbi:hypothetical protein [Mangrovibacterium lignilyticum]|uniref:hypothetical protein n=1 Tax=Mangrovibacterium lignilyticum TaxID=2668052 RepID=UPI0013D2638C|nr:hypothetical protein [Mangrovibacterium lignilyticum]